MKASPVYYYAAYLYKTKVYVSKDWKDTGPLIFTESPKDAMWFDNLDTATRYRANRTKLHGTVIIEARNKRHGQTAEKAKAAQNQD